MGAVYGIIFALLKPLFLLPKLQFAFGICVSALSGLLALVESFCLTKFYVKISPALMQIIFDTNDFSEIESFFSNYFDLPSLLLLIFYFVLCLVILFTHKRIYLKFLQHKKILIASFCILIVFSFAGVGKIGRLSSSAPIARYIHSIKYMYKIRAKLKTMTADKTNKVEIVSNNSNLPYVVFVIGESASRHFMDLYGSDYKTTPLCRKLSESGNFSLLQMLYRQEPLLA